MMDRAIFYVVLFVAFAATLLGTLAEKSAVHRGLMGSTVDYLAAKEYERTKE